MIEKNHLLAGRYLKDAVYGANDGVVTTFAVVAGVSGANLSPEIVFIIGAANLLADGFSMAVSNYLGAKSETEFFHEERNREEREVREIPVEERAEVRRILTQKGYAGSDLASLTELIVKNPSFWVDFMMREELRLEAHDMDNPRLAALVTFIAFAVCGAIPIIAYVLALSRGVGFLMASLASGLTLFCVGALRAFFTGKSKLFSGLEVLLIGGIAATLAYLVGLILKLLI